MKYSLLEKINTYLPFRINAEILDYRSDYVGKKYDTIISIHQWAKDESLWSCQTIGGAKPSYTRILLILKPLSDLIKDKELYNEFLKLDENNSFALDYVCEMSGDITRFLRYNIIFFLIKNHFDVFGMIKEKKAIDINTTKQ